jgi:hypothetical protein
MRRPLDFLCLLLTLVLEQDIKASSMDCGKAAGFCTAVILVLLSVVSAQAQVDFVTTLGTGALLSKLDSTVKEAEEKAIGGGMVLEIGADGILSQAIRQAQDAYANSLQLTIDKLSGEEQQTLGSLTSAVNDFVNKTSGSMSALEDKAKAIIHQLPFTKNYPQVVSYLPQYVSKQDFNDDGTIRVRLDGDFIDVTRPRYTPQLKVGTATYEPTAKTNDFIEFHVEPKDLVFADKGITTNQLHFDIPWRKPELWGAFDKEEHTEFILPVVTLPALAGKVTITTTVVSNGVVRQNAESPEMRQESGDDDIKDGGQHADLAIHRWPASPGFQVVPRERSLSNNLESGERRG